RERSPLDVERALTAIFAREGSDARLRIEGTYSAVLARLTAPTLEAGFRYLIARPHPAAPWTPVLELGERANGLDIALSRELAGCDVFTATAYGQVFAGYRAARGGALLDQYCSDPTVSRDEDVDAADSGERVDDGVSADLRGHPERFADLLPADTSPEDFARVVLRPGYWEQVESEQGSGGVPTAQEDNEEGDEIVDEVDRMRCIALALELWGPEEYPFACEPEDIPNATVGPAVALAFA
ncbi:MAG TPA: hypothetical protein VJN88_14965, partial [Ktedonobacterales bacterium]|nr:hypothetical protein [Ktedonobacterales bacterium]